MKKKYELEDKRKLTEIKKIFKIEKFNKILHFEERGSIFDALEKISKIDISFFDSFHIKMGLVKSLYLIHLIFKFILQENQILI